MKVVTLDPQRFAWDCRRLGDLAYELGEYDVLIGIRSGGYVVAEAMVSHRADLQERLFPITRRRPSTAAKSRLPILTRILRTLPYGVTNRLRLIEHRVLTRNVGKQPSQPPGTGELDPVETERLTQVLRQFLTPRVLIIDDAIDTGSTMKIVGDFVRTVASQAVLRSAVLVTTTAAPLVEPDVTLYRNVLCRFPWSHDFRR